MAWKHAFRPVRAIWQLALAIGAFTLTGWIGLAFVVLAMFDIETTPKKVRANGRWLSVGNRCEHREPGGPWIDFCDLKPRVGVTTGVIGGLFAGQTGKVVEVDYGTRKARFELNLNRLKGETDG